MFIDTNVLVNSRILEAPQHSIARPHLERAFSGDEPLVISRQIIREYLAVVTRPQNWPVPITYDQTLEDVNSLLSTYEILEDGPVVTDQLLDLCRSVSAGGKQIHDANIVATMLAYGERRLLTLNAADFRRYNDRIELVDTLTAPESVMVESVSLSAWRTISTPVE